MSDDYEETWVRNHKLAEGFDRAFIGSKIIDHPNWSDEDVARALSYDDHIVRDFDRDLVNVRAIRRELEN